MNNEIFLFCGGKRKYHNSYISKPLFLMNNGKSVIHNFLSLNINNFQKIHLLVEKNEIDLFEKEVGRHKVDIVETPDKSPTIFKFKTVLNTFDIYPKVLIRPLTCVHTHIYMYIYIYTHAYIHGYKHIHTTIYIYTYIYICIYIYNYVYVRTRTHTHTHIYAYSILMHMKLNTCLRDHN